MARGEIDLRVIKVVVNGEQPSLPRALSSFLFVPAFTFLCGRCPMTLK